ncbi:MAG: hypothetical protein ACTSWW_03925 [Promethearchaeota archaeon]
MNLIKKSQAKFKGIINILLVEMEPSVRNKRRIFQRISPDRAVDLHLHSNWSQDNLNGPAMAEYIPLAEKFNLHIGFADHFELLYYEKTSQNQKYGKWRLTPDTIDKYLEEIDSLKEHYPFVSSGLEMGFSPTPSRNARIRDFIDDYRNDFDLFLGGIHEIEDFHAVVMRQDLEILIQKYGSFERVVEKYFDLEEAMVQSQIFDAIAHPDVIFRFLNPQHDEQVLKYRRNTRIFQIGELCQETGTMMEVNLSGYRFAWGDSLPSLDKIHHLLASGVSFIVGSDSHSLTDLSQSILRIRKINNLIREIDEKPRMYHVF